MKFLLVTDSMTSLRMMIPLEQIEQILDMAPGRYVVILAKEKRIVTTLESFDAIWIALTVDAQEPGLVADAVWAQREIDKGFKR